MAAGSFSVSPLAKPLYFIYRHERKGRACFPFRAAAHEPRERCRTTLAVIWRLLSAHSLSLPSLSADYGAVEGSAGSASGSRGQHFSQARPRRRENVVLYSNVRKSSGLRDNAEPSAPLFIGKLTRRARSRAHI